MSLDADVLVVGAGPAGSSAAYHLARQGADVLLVDKASFPREKPCGDGLSPYGVRAVARMGIDTAEAGFTRVTGLRSYGLDGVVVDLEWPKLRRFPDYGVVRTRFELDHLLAMRAEKAGARLVQEAEAAGPILEGGRVCGAVLREAGTTREVRARFVVAADGASSRLAAQAGIRRDAGRPLGIAARRYYRMTRRMDPVMESYLHFKDPETGGVIAGYGWLFPLEDGLVNVGAGLLNTYPGFRQVSARKILDIFLAQLPPEWGISEEHAEGPVLSGPIPMGINREPVAIPGMLLVGDAGGMVNPFNGEGIGFAVETGELAAEMIGDALARGRPAIAQMYPAMVRRRYGPYFTIGNRWARWIGNPRFMRFAVEHGFPRRRLMEFALRMMANLTDGKGGGSTDDKVIHLLLSMARGA